MKKTIALLTAFILSFSSVCVFAQFDDIDSETLSWAGEAVESLCASGIINGYEDGTFRPDANVTRGEFAKMITVAFNLDKTDAGYDDISLHWANGYIISAADVMYTEGTSFEPDKAASRADIAYCAAKVLNLAPSDETLIEKYSDYKKIPSAMVSMICAAAENGIVLGYEDSTLRPDNPVTRAEAAVIVYRALQLKDKPNEEPKDEPEEKPQEPNVPPTSDKDDVSDVKDHLSHLYPGKDLILVVSVNKTVDSQNGEDAYKITYKLAGDKTEYSSVVPWDTAVTGIKTDISALSAGDVMVMNTAFHGYIGNLYVFASLGSSFNFDHTITGYAKDYTVAGGKIKDLKRAGKNTVVTLEAGGLESTVYVPLNLEANVFSPWNKKDKWSYGDINDVDPLTEEEYAFIRFTNGVATDLVVSDFVR